MVIISQSVCVGNHVHLKYFSFFVSYTLIRPGWGNESQSLTFQQIETGGALQLRPFLPGLVFVRTVCAPVRTID